MLDISAVSLGYGSEVLRFSGLKLGKGEQCLITGPSGSGKTTLLYSIAGLLDVLSGKISIGDTEITGLSEQARDHFRGRHIGMIFQTLHLVKSLSVIENLMLASYVSGMPQDRAYAESILKKLDIYDKKDALPSQLSQGQAQRVAIARAVLHHPVLLLADEPTSSLDDASCEAVITLIRQVAEENNATLLISTHDARVKKYFTQVVNVGVPS